MPTLGTCGCVKAIISKVCIGVLLCTLSWASMVSADELSTPIKTEIVERDGRYVFLRDSQPYVVRGAGVDARKLEEFAARGGNSVRTWGTENAADFLDRAHELGITVALCLGVGRERQGFDYDDEQAVAAQLARLRKEVIAYRNHPALLSWIIGNELNLEHTNPKVYDAVNDIAQMIHELDPNHPTTSTLAGFNSDLAKLVNTRAPALDFVSVQLYADLVNLPKYLRQNRFRRPYMVTEWGAIGHWEMPATYWGAPVEQDSSKKARNYQKMYNKVIRHDSPYNLGAYVFFWGQKQERTPTWYGLFLPTGESTEAVDVMQRIWTGESPKNQAPQIKSLRLYNRQASGNVTLKSGKEYVARVKAADPDGDSLRYQWEVRVESRSTNSGGDFEELPPMVPGVLAEGSGSEVRVRAPREGAYRLFVYVYDDQGHGAHANIPFVARG